MRVGEIFVFTQWYDVFKKTHARKQKTNKNCNFGDGNLKFKKCFNIEMCLEASRIK